MGFLLLIVGYLPIFSWSEIARESMPTQQQKDPPEAAILAVGSARQVPVIVDGEMVPGWRMKATISVDHRVSDGVEAAQFLQALAVYLEEPVRLLI